MTARDEVMTRIRSALAGQPVLGVVPREYRVTADDAPGTDAVLERFIDRLVDYKASVNRTGPLGLAAAIASVLQRDDAVVVPPELPAAWREACAGDGRRVRVDGDPTSL